MAVFYYSNLTNYGTGASLIYTEGLTSYFMASTGFGAGDQVNMWAADVTRANGTDGTSDWVAGLCANGLPATPYAMLPDLGGRIASFQNLSLALPCSQQQQQK